MEDEDEDEEDDEDEEEDDEDDDDEEKAGGNNDTPGPKSSSPCALCVPASVGDPAENSNPAPSNRDRPLPTVRFNRFSGEPT